MDNWRLILAIGLSFVVFLAWSIAFGPKQPPPNTAPDQQAAQKLSQETKPSETKTAESPPSPDTTPETPPESVTVPEVPSHPARRITVQTPLYDMVLSEQGAAVVSMTLQDFKESVQADSPHKELVPPALDGGNVLLSMSGIPGRGLSHGVYTVDTPDDTISVRDGVRELRFVYTAADNVKITKAYRFSPETYLVDIDITVTNDSGRTISSDLRVGLRDQIDQDNSVYGFTGPSGLVNDRLEQIKTKKIEEQNKVEGEIRWIAIERLYFMDSLICKTPVNGFMALHKKTIEDKKAIEIENQLVLPTAELAAGQTRTAELSLFMGPKSISVLKSIGNQLDRALNFGWVDIIARPCLYFMNFIYKFIPNYGIAIIILTILTRVIFWPLAQKSYKSMNDMRKLQPLMQELREKYKDDKVKLNQETMALYRTYKINPLGGCLPMLIQLPVFFALYRMLYQAIELRHAPFFGWINDLSAPDRLFHFNFKVPFMNEPYGIPVLTLIMGATMLLQQKMSPQAGDPTQAKMMMLMPVVFTFIFINFPSGLVLYWLVGNLISIAQQYLTLRKAA